MAREVRTPISYTPAVELGNNLWWKQVLPADRKIKYGDRWIQFDEQYCRAAADAFQRKAHDTTSFVLAPESNSHTLAAEAGANGEVLAAKVDMDAVNPQTGEPAPGLYYALKLSDTANGIVQSNPRFGVSLRMKEDWTRSDGQHFAVAPQHCLGTWDPVLNGMSPWQPYAGQAGELDLSNPPGTAVIDLSGLTYESPNQEGADVTAPSSETTETDPSPGPDQSDQTEAFAAFQRWMAAGQPDPGTGDETEAGDEQAEDDGQDDGESGDDEQAGEFDVDGMSDDEFSAFLDEIVADEPAEVAASNADAAVELSNGQDPRVVELSQANATLQRRLDASDYEREADEIVRRTGLPPHVVDLARPLLEGTGHVVELSNADGLSERDAAGKVMRNVLDEIGSLVQVLDLSEPQLAHLQPVTDEATEQAERRSDNAKRFLSNAGL